MPSLIKPTCRSLKWTHKRLHRCVATSPLALCWMCDSPRMGYVRRTAPIYMWREQAIIGWLRGMIFNFACCHSANFSPLPLGLFSRSRRLQQPQHHMGLRQHYSNSDGELLENWAAANLLSLVYDAKLPRSFNTVRWNKGYNADLTFVSPSIAHQSEKSSSIQSQTLSIVQLVLRLTQFSNLMNFPSGDG